MFGNAARRLLMLAGTEAAAFILHIRAIRRSRRLRRRRRRCQRRCRQNFVWVLRVLFVIVGLYLIAVATVSAVGSAAAA